MSRAPRVLFAFVLVVGCESPFGAPDPAAGLFFDVTADAYSPGEFAEYRLTNDSKKEFTYSFCFAWLERNEGDRWVFGGSGENCIALGYLLAPGETVTGGEFLPADLSPGAYRFTMRVGASDSHLYTRTFHVE